MVAACVLFSAMAVAIKYAVFLEPGFDIFIGSFLRSAVSLGFVLGGVIFFGQKNVIIRPTWALFLRGVFGSSSLICFFYSVSHIGLTEAAFFQATSAVWVALLAPWVLQKKNPKSAYVAIFGSMVGIYLMYHPSFVIGDIFGRQIAFANGVLSAFAYLTISRSGNKYSAQTIVFYFSLVATLIHLIGFGLFRFEWPKQATTYALSCFAGVLAYYAQLCMTKAYQLSAAAHVAAVSYLTQILNTIFGFFLFHERLSIVAQIGAILILVFGLSIPFLTVKEAESA